MNSITDVTLEVLRKM